MVAWPELWSYSKSLFCQQAQGRVWGKFYQKWNCSCFSRMWLRISHSKPFPESLFLRWSRYRMASACRLSPTKLWLRRMIPPKLPATLEAYAWYPLANLTTQRNFLLTSHLHEVAYVENPFHTRQAWISSIKYWAYFDHSKSWQLMAFIPYI